jgi:uncharacterized protein YndB with AHSA1/START domain
MNDLKIKKEITINADVGKVWEALTKPDMIKKYMQGIEIVSDWKVGSTILWIETLKEGEMIQGKGSIEKIEVRKLLQFTTLDMNAQYSDVPSNYVQATYELTPKLGKTVLSITQGDYSRVEDGNKRFNESNENWNQTLSALKQFIENR